MAEETIIADEQNEIDESNDTEVTESDDDDTYVNDLEAKLAKAEADKAKWEARYKSTKKQEVKAKPQETKEVTKDVDLDSLVERKLMAIEEQREFIKTHGEDVYNEVKKVKEKHPTLSLEDAYKISPVGKDEASKEDPSTYSMGGRPNAKAINDGKTITQEKLVQLDRVAYRLMKDRIAKGEVTLKN